tara:strand:- start:7096 stop:7428 length:333 start_codon:yes stop_codon:yes gene_type:complete
MVEKKTIAIGGELRPIHYGFAALAEWCDLTGSGLNDLSQLGDNMSMSAAIQLIYCGLRHGARRSKEEFNYSIDDVADWIDEEGMDIFTDAMAIFADAMVKINPSKKKKKK